MAPLYHRARPRYPDALFNDLFEVTRLAPPARLLEIGPGSGIATLVLAERGFQVVGVEMDEGMALAARENLARWDYVEIVTSSFETYASDERFDAILAFSAFHWIDPSERYRKAASLLRDSGFLIVADTRLVATPDGDPFFTEVDEDYEDVLGERAHAPGAPGLEGLHDQINENGFFSHLSEHRYGWEVRHTAASYIELLDTVPWYRALEPSERVELYARIRRRIEEQRDGTVAVRFAAVLDIATRKQEAGSASGEGAHRTDQK